MIRLEIIRALRAQAIVTFDQLYGQRFDDRTSELFLHFEDVVDVAVVRLGPETVTVVDVNELGCHPNSIRRLADAAFQNGFNAKAFSNLGRVHPEAA